MQALVRELVWELARELVLVPRLVQVEIWKGEDLPMLRRGSRLLEEHDEEVRAW
jgi:hypothetical protein